MLELTFFENKAYNIHFVHNIDLSRIYSVHLFWAENLTYVKPPGQQCSQGFAGISYIKPGFIFITDAPVGTIVPLACSVIAHEWLLLAPSLYK